MSFGLLRGPVCASWLSIFVPLLHSGDDLRHESSSFSFFSQRQHYDQERNVDCFKSRQRP